MSVFALQRGGAHKAWVAALPFLLPAPPANADTLPTPTLTECGQPIVMIANNLFAPGSTVHGVNQVASTDPRKLTAAGIQDANIVCPDVTFAPTATDTSNASAMGAVDAAWALSKYGPSGYSNDIIAPSRAVFFAGGVGDNSGTLSSVNRFNFHEVKAAAALVNSLDLTFVGQDSNGNVLMQTTKNAYTVGPYAPTLLKPSGFNYINRLVVTPSITPGASQIYLNGIDDTVSNVALNGLTISFSAARYTPTAVMATANGTAITLSWAKEADHTQDNVLDYAVYSSNSPNGPWTQRQKVNGTSITFNNQAYGQYYYTVTAENIAGQGPFSPAVPIKLTAPPDPTPPANSGGTPTPPANGGGTSASSPNSSSGGAVDPEVLGVAVGLLLWRRRAQRVDGPAPR